MTLYFMQYCFKLYNDWLAFQGVIVFEHAVWLDGYNGMKSYHFKCTLIF